MSTATIAPADVSRELSELIAPLQDAFTALAKVIDTVNKANGWQDRDRSFGEDIALLHSEVSEALEAFRSDGLADTTVSLCRPCAETPDKPHICKPEGVASELADAVIRILDTTTVHKIGADVLARVVLAKLLYNSTRGYRHGGKVI